MRKARRLAPDHRSSRGRSLRANDHCNRRGAPAQGSPHPVWPRTGGPPGGPAARPQALVGALGAWEAELSPTSGARRRRIRRYLLTGLDPVRFHRWKCHQDGRHHFPLDRALGLSPWQTRAAFVWERACRLGLPPYLTAASGRSRCSSSARGTRSSRPRSCSCTQHAAPAVREDPPAPTWTSRTPTAGSTWMMALRIIMPPRARADAALPRWAPVLASALPSGT